MTHQYSWQLLRAGTLRLDGGGMFGVVPKPMWSKLAAPDDHNHVGLAFSISYDMEPYTNMLSKRQLLEEASNRGWRIVIDHEPGNPVVRVEPDSNRAGQFRLLPAE